MARWLKTVVLTLALTTLGLPAFAQDQQRNRDQDQAQDQVKDQVQAQDQVKQQDQVKAQLHDGTCTGTCDGTKKQLRLKDGSGSGAQLRKQLRTETKQMKQAHGGGGAAYRGGK